MWVAMVMFQPIVNPMAILNVVWYAHNVGVTKIIYVGVDYLA